MTGGNDRSATAPSASVRRRRRVRWTIGVLVLIVVAGGGGTGLYAWLTRTTVYRPGEAMDEITHTLGRDLPEGAPQVRFVDVTEQAGLAAFRSFAGRRSSQLPEDMGPGAAWGDYDDDGDDDLFLVSGGGPLAAAPETRAACALYENRGDGTFRADGRFPDVRILGRAAAWGDADGDGRPDLVVTGQDEVILFRNRGERFERDDAFAAPSGFWAGASWGDYDNDRDLDLYVCGYVRYVEDDADRARASQQFGRAVPYTLNPSSYEPERNLLFRNEGDGTFVEVAETLGVANPEGRSLQAVWHDFDEDGRLDLYVANDVSDNAFYRNTGDGFEDVSHAAWVADYRGAMGLAVGDYDRDGDDDIFVTHWIAQENALFESLRSDHAQGEKPGPLRFVDVASVHGVGYPALQMIGWGAEFADVDADGWSDLVVANGSTFETGEDRARLEPQPAALFWNRDGRFFHDLAPFCAAFSTPRVSRGLAISDYDLDGDLDVLLVDVHDGVRLLRNDMRTGHWLELRLRGAGRGAGEGAIVVVEAGGVTWRRAVTAASYLSQSSRVVHVGLGAASRVDRVEVRWPGGRVSVYEGLEADARWELHEGDETPRRAARAPMSDRERVMRFWELQRAAMTAMRRDGATAETIRLFRAALALDPTHTDARYYLASCLAASGETAAAVHEYDELIERDPGSHRAHKGLGVLLATEARSRDELARALTVLERALAINKEETGVLLAMADVELLLGEDARAAQRLEWVSRTNPRAVGALFLRGYLAWRGGDEAAARDLLARAAEARGDEWVPEGTTSEGDVARRMHVDVTPLSRFWQAWDGSLEPPAAFGPLATFLDARK